MSGFKEYPEIEFPRWLADMGFADESWHNDAAARATRHVEGLPEFWDVSVYVDYDDPANRECEGSKYGVVLYDGEQQYVDSRDADTEADVRAHVAELEAIARDRHAKG